MNSGLLLLDKPAGPTSHDAVQWARRALGTKRAGHCGSLDPLATGLLLVVIEDAVKWQDRFMTERKAYSGRIRLGVVTDTDDLAGKPLNYQPRRPVSDVSEEELRRTFREFLGPQEQKVPLYSAVKVNGRRLYEMARAGEKVELPSKSIQIYRFDMLSYAPPEAEFFMECSKGTYVRSAARDLGEKLGVGATLAALCRESIGPFNRAKAYAWGGGRDVDMDKLMNSFVPFEILSSKFEVRSPK